MAEGGCGHSEVYEGGQGDRTHQEHNVQGVRTDLEDDFWKALQGGDKQQRRYQEIPEEVKHEKIHYWRSALNSNLDIVLTVYL